MRSNNEMTYKATVDARHSLPTFKTGTHDLIHAIEHQHTSARKVTVNDTKDENKSWRVLPRLRNGRSLADQGTLPDLPRGK